MNSRFFKALGVVTAGYALAMILFLFLLSFTSAGRTTMSTIGLVRLLGWSVIGVGVLFTLIYFLSGNKS